MVFRRHRSRNCSNGPGLSRIRAARSVSRNSRFAGWSAQQQVACLLGGFVVLGYGVIVREFCGLRILRDQGYRRVVKKPRPSSTLAVAATKARDALSLYSVRCIRTQSSEIWRSDVGQRGSSVAWKEKPGTLVLADGNGLCATPGAESTGQVTRSSGGRGARGERRARRWKAWNGCTLGQVPVTLFAIAVWS